MRHDSKSSVGGIRRTMVLSAPRGGFAAAHAANRPRAGTGRRFSPPVKQFFEDDRIVMRLVLRGKEQGKALSPVSQLVEPAQRDFGVSLRQFLQIFLAKVLPVVGPGVIPAAQFVGRSNFAQPFMNRDVRLRETSRPQTVDQYAGSVASRSRQINAFDRNCHDSK